MNEAFAARISPNLTHVICRRVLTVNKYSLTIKEWSFVSNATNNFLSNASFLSPKLFFLSVYLLVYFTNE